MPWWRKATVITCANVDSICSLMASLGYNKLLLPLIERLLRQKGLVGQNVSFNANHGDEMTKGLYIYICNCKFQNFTWYLKYRYILFTLHFLIASTYLQLHWIHQYVGINIAWSHISYAVTVILQSFYVNTIESTNGRQAVKQTHIALSSTANLNILP